MRAIIPDRTCVLITRVCAIITLRYISYERATMSQCLGKTVETRWSSVNGGRPTVNEPSDVARETVPDPWTSNNNDWSLKTDSE